MIDIVIEADVVSKKNQYAQTKAGRRYKPKSIVDTEALAMMQIDPALYGIEIKHPAIEFFSFIPKKSWSLDRDGVFTTILDYLVKYKILKDDNIRHNNGLILFHPTLESERKKFVIRIHEDGILLKSKVEDVQLLQCRI